MACLQLCDELAMDLQPTKGRTSGRDKPLPKSHEKVEAGNDEVCCKMQKNSQFSLPLLGVELVDTFVHKT